jgi:plastocyanin
MTRLSLAACALLCSAASVYAQDATASLTIRNHHFEPSTLTIKAGVKVRLTVHNAGNAPAEFESSELNREKVIAPGGTVTIYVGPLEPGTYPFFDDFDQANRGQIVVK